MKIEKELNISILHQRSWANHTVHLKIQTCIHRQLAIIPRMLQQT
jgi:hypothetical protein